MTVLKPKIVEHVRELRPGDYYRVVNEDVWVLYKCPKCGFVTSIGRSKHYVHYDGAVSPAVNCPHKVGGGGKCSFSEEINLEGWIPEAKGFA